MKVRDIGNAIQVQCSRIYVRKRSVTAQPTPARSGCGKVFDSLWLLATSIPFLKLELTEICKKYKEETIFLVIK